MYGQLCQVVLLPYNVKKFSKTWQLFANRRIKFSKTKTNWQVSIKMIQMKSGSQPTDSFGLMIKVVGLVPAFNNLCALITTHEIIAFYWRRLLMFSFLYNCHLSVQVIVKDLFKFLWYTNRFWNFSWT